jgi:ribulose-phosphate 3-epimerase
MIRIYPSLMAADPLCLKNEIQLLAPYCAGFHLDVMDNHFVPNITWGADTVNAIAQLGYPVWVHLMVEKPDAFYDRLKLPEDSIVSFHIESNLDIFGFIKIIKEKKHKASIAISPKTSISRIVSLLHDIDQVLVMSVEPGFSGQSFLKSSLDRISELVEHRQKVNATFRIGIDGGIDATNIGMVVERGVDDCAIGSAIFRQPDHSIALQKLQKLVEKDKEL